MGGGKGGSSGGGSYPDHITQTVRYAPYLESFHSNILNDGGSDTADFSFLDVFNATMCKHPGFSDETNEDLIYSPYGNYEQLDIDEGFFGMTVEDPDVTYEIKNFPSLWDMFGKFMAGLDVHDLWSQIYQDVIQGPEIENAVSAQSDLLQDEIDTNVLPKFVAGMRDINSVQATTFVIGKAIIQDAHVKAINEFSSKIRIHALDISNDQWKAHLVWDESVINVYAKLFELYYRSKMEMDKQNADFVVKDYMWDINLYENARAILAALSGSAAGTDTQNKSSGGSLSSALGGAAVGAGAGYLLADALAAPALGLPFAIGGGLLGLGLGFL